MLDLAWVALLSYMLGSIPTGWLLARLKKIDVRTTGSGNIGATNVARSAGKTLGILTLILDAAKGALPVLLAERLTLATHPEPGFAQHAALVAALAALLGHVFSIFLRFRGGKGVATGLGAILALAPGATVLPLLAFVLVFAASRRVSLGSLVAAISAPLGSALAGYERDVTATIAAMAAVIVLRHRDNIARLVAGTEPRFGESGGKRPT